jgi:hypothetical protein
MFKITKTLITGAVTFCAVLFSSHAGASTQGLFSSDGKKLTVLLAAVTTNPDAIQLFDVMNVPIEDAQGKRTKKILFTDSDGVKALSILCVFSKIVPNLGSCTVSLETARGMLIEPAAKHLGYTIQGDQAAALAELFIQKPGSDELFKSSDQHLIISAQKSAGARVTSFTLEYK